MAWIEGKQIVRNDSIEINKKIKSLEDVMQGYAPESRLY